MVRFAQSGLSDPVCRCTNLSMAFDHPWASAGVGWRASEMGYYWYLLRFQCFFDSTVIGTLWGMWASCLCFPEYFMVAVLGRGLISTTSSMNGVWIFQSTLLNLYRYQDCPEKRMCCHVYSSQLFLHLWSDTCDFSRPVLSYMILVWGDLHQTLPTLGIEPRTPLVCHLLANRAINVCTGAHQPAFSCPWCHAALRIGAVLCSAPAS